jgi:hypothetical protein
MTFLHPAIVTARDDLVVARQHGADRQASLGDALFSFGNGLGHEIVVILLNCQCQ